MKFRLKHPEKAITSCPNLNRGTKEPLATHERESIWTPEEDSELYASFYIEDLSTSPNISMAPSRHKCHPVEQMSILGLMRRG